MTCYKIHTLTLWIVGRKKISLPPPPLFLDIIERNAFKSKVPEPPSTSLMFCLISASAHKILFCFATKKFLIPCNNFYNNYDLYVTIMCHDDQLSLTKNWVGCLLTDSKIFILFAENSQILLKISVIHILWTFMYLLAVFNLRTNSIHRLTQLIIAAHNCHSNIRKIKY